ncbi:MAG: carboxypeptidase regulatory-like domain-containing protein [candidate division WOR-3 bacterium]
MLWLLLVGNPHMPIEVYEFYIGETAEESWVEVQGYVDSEESLKLVTSQCTVALKPGLNWDDGLVVLDTSTLEGPLCFDPISDTIKILDTLDQVWCWFDYGPEGYSCGQSSCTPPPGFSMAMSPNMNWWYPDPTPTPGAHNDDWERDTNTIEGTVRDAGTGEPIQGARVFFRGSMSLCHSPDTHLVYSGTDGSYWTYIAPGWNRLTYTVSAPGYDTLRDSLEYHCNWVHLEMDIYLNKTGTSESPGEEKAYLRLSPNPSPGLLKLSWSKGPQDVFIYDVLGREIKALPGELGYAEINLPPGVYLVSRGKERIRAIVKSNRR